MYPIAGVELQFGALGGPNLKITDPSVTLFVGPNNSGKSLVLRELWGAVTEGSRSGHVLKALAFAASSAEFTRRSWEKMAKAAKVPIDGADDESVQITIGSASMSTAKANWLKMLSNLADVRQDQIRFLLPSILLDGFARLQLVNQQELRSLHQPSSSFARLYTNDSARLRLRKILFEAFGKHLVIDASVSPGNARLRFARTDPPIELERSLTTDAIAFMNAALPIEAMSDGVKAFTGILVELFAGDPAILIVDEPEAFLHPTLSFLLGREICKPAAEGMQKNVFIATHDPGFLMGSLASGAKVDVVRLTHSDGGSTARHLPAETLRRLMRNPLLRSVGAMEALFYDYVIVTEADADRAFYEEINQRLALAGDPRAIPNCLFLRAQNKHTVSTIVKPLRALGIPCAGIVDVDVYEEGGKVWSQLVESAGMDAATADGSAIVRSRVKGYFEALGTPKPKVRGGVNLLSGAERQAADNLFDQLGDHGIFVVRHGEVEHWLPGVATSGLHGPEWLVAAFERMGEEPSDAAYMKPSAGDVWDFVGLIGTWLKRDRRKGM